jgi:hypothetical protein
MTYLGILVVIANSKQQVEGCRQQQQRQRQVQAQSDLC